MDNPTYDNKFSVTATTSRIASNEEDERLFLNPIYSQTDVGHCSSNKSNPYHPYEDIKADTPVSTSYRKCTCSKQ
jgi:hypothetical protein